MAFLSRVLGSFATLVKVIRNKPSSLRGSVLTTKTLAISLIGTLIKPLENKVLKGEDADCTQLRPCMGGLRFRV